MEFVLHELAMGGSEQEMAIKLKPLPTPDNHYLCAAQGWVGLGDYAQANEELESRLDHAAYLGKELMRAELSLKHGFKFDQDGSGIRYP